MSLSLWTRLFNWKKLRRTPLPSAIAVTMSEGSSTVDKGTDRVVRVTVLRTGARYSGTLTPSTNSLPSGVSASFSPATLSPSDGFTDMTLTADSGAGSITDDAYTVTVSGTGINAVTVNQLVTVPSPVPPQSISIAPDDDTVSIVQGQTADITYTLTRVGAYTADVPLAVTGLPSGVTASYPDGQTYSGSDQTKRVRLTVDIAASTVTNDAFTTTAAGDGGSVSDATDNGTVTVTAYVPPSGATPARGDDFTGYADNAAFLAETGTLASGKKYQVNGIYGANNGACSLDTTVTYNGHPTIKFRWWDGSTTTPRLYANGATIASCWTQRIFKYQPGFSLNLNNGYSGAKAQKTANYTYSGATGRSLGAITNGTNNVPGAVGNSGDIQWESQHDSGGSVADNSIYLNVTLRGVIASGSAMFDDDTWYEEIVHFEAVSTYHSRTRVWLNKVGETRTLLCTINNHDRDYAAPTGIGSQYFFDTFNASSGGAPVGVDQACWLGEWQTYDDATDPDPFGLGYTGGVNCTLDAAIDNANVSLTAGGSSATRTVTFTRGSDLTSRAVETQTGDFWPAGLFVSYSKTSIPSAENTVTLTLTAGAACAPGTYTRNIMFRTTQRSGVGQASAYVAITFTVT